MTRTVFCPAPGCRDRRRHWTHPDTSRGPQSISVPDNWTPDTVPVWCSLTCAMMAGALSAKDPQLVFWKNFLERFKERSAHFHGEGDPPDLILEVMPSTEDDRWHVVYRPNGHPDTDAVRNGMCWEMYCLLEKLNV